MSRSKKPRKVRPQQRHDIRWWTADDALRVQARTVDWLRTGEGTKGVYVTYHGFYQSNWPDNMDPWQMSAGAASSTADMIADADLIWCDPPMVDLLAAAASLAVSCEDRAADPISADERNRPAGLSRSRPGRGASPSI